LGSLYAAAASYLDARAHGGRWIVRMENVDRGREVRGSAEHILRTLETFGFEWDGDVLRQSDRDGAYAQAIEDLRARGLTFECSCSRLALADEERYPGYCRNGPMNPGAATATRLRVDPGYVQFTDRIQGTYRQDVAMAVGDLVLKRRDQLYAYLLAVVVDDAFQGVTHVVRGADLLDNTPRQIHLQRQLGLPTPSYAHVPVLVEADGAKLAKSARSVQLDSRIALPQLRSVFGLLGLDPPTALADGSIGEAWAWAMERWDPARVPRGLHQRLRLEHSQSNLP
jgi:glutamyl-Q tRNA(Asp) synthetase